MAGFTSGDGGFGIRVLKKDKKDKNCAFIFYLTQDMRDKDLILSFIKFFNCGYTRKDRSTINFEVYKFIDIYTKIIPFFKKYHILGVKQYDFKD